jgi:predicted RNase H-like HicB family nuclease
MKKFYIAGIVPESDADGGGYSVYFPDVPNVAAGGDSVAEAIANAASGLCLALRGMAERNMALPEPSSLEEARAKVRAEREGDGLPCPDDTLYQYIEAPCLDTAAVRVNISLPRGLLEEMDAQAELRGQTRSGLIAAAAREYLNGSPLRG